MNVTSAQNSDSTWSQPFNLSNSGSSTRPILVVDSSNTFHAIWLAQNDGYFYRNSKDGKSWSTPILVDFPFKRLDSIPQLIPDVAGNIHAFWTREDHVLRYSQAKITDMKNPAAWKTAIDLAESALDFNVAIDSAGSLHVSYVRGLNTNGIMAGIYYRRSMDAGVSWIDGVSLYNSQYFRSMGSKDAHVRIATTHSNNAELVYVAFDNRTLKRIFLAKSINSGSSWDNPVEIQGPQAGSAAESPFYIEIMAQGQNALLLWRSGVPESSESRCIQYSKWSIDQGQHWGDAQFVLKDRWTCPLENEFITVKDGSFLIKTNLQYQMFLLAWNGDMWSKPQLQSDLALFTNAETFTKVSLGCFGTKWKSDNQLFLIGCDISGGGDIWFSNRAIESINDWFSLSSWTIPQNISSTTNLILSPVIISDSTGRLHIFWCQLDKVNNISTINIFYRIWNKDRWSQAYSIISSPNGDTVSPQITYDFTNNSFIAVWKDSQDGLLYSSRTNVENAASSVDWSKPEVIPVNQNVIGSFELKTAGNGEISLIYAVPINENRGIYVIQSTDHGKTWTNPAVIFNAVAAGLNKVDSPHFLHVADGRLHVIWSQFLYELNTARGLYYAYSADTGLTWSVPKQMTNSNFSYSGISSAGENGLIIYWQENLEESLSTWWQLSPDGGVSWSQAAQILNAREPLGPLAVTVDSTSTPYLLRIARDNSTDQMLELWNWQSGSWLNKDSILLDNNPTSSIQSLAPVISSTGILTVLYTDEVNAGKLKPDFSLVVTNRAITPSTDVPSQQPVFLLPTLMPSSTPLPQSTATPTLAPVQTQPPVTQSTPSSNAPLSTKTLVLIGGAALLILLGAGIGIFWFVRKRKRAEIGYK